MTAASRLAAGQRAAGPVLGVAAIAAAAYFLTSGSYLSTVFEDVLVFAIAAMGLDFLGGFGGLISLGQAGFLGLGAYGVAVAEVHGFPPWQAVGIAVVVVLVAAAIAGVAAVRVSGLTFVIISLAIGQILWGLSYQWTSLTGGDNGLPIGAYPSVGPLQFSNPRTVQWVTLAVFVLVLGLLLVMVRSPFGLSLRGLKSNEPRLRALGYHTGLQRYLGFLISALCAGIAGILYLFSNSLISPSSLEFGQDGILVLMVILGGLGTIWGSCLGALVIVLFQQEVSIYVSRWQTVLGVVFIAAVIFTPDGIAGLLRAASRAIQGLAARLAVPPGQLAVPSGQVPGPPPQAGPQDAESVETQRTAAGPNPAAGPGQPL
jgi:branched-chain amino acid transport system permease protein